MYILYLTTNLVNSKIYVGIHETDNPYKFDGYIGLRIWANKPSSYMHPKTPFAYDVKKYGPNSFKRCTLKVCETFDEIKKWEQTIVNQTFISRSDTYNTFEEWKSHPQSDKIYQYSLDGSFIREWESQTEASKFYNLNYGKIGRYIKMGKPIADSQWSWIKVEKMKDLSTEKNSATPRRIGKFDDDGNLLEEYLTVNEAQKISSNVSAVLKGKRKHAGGYIWKYLD